MKCAIVGRSELERADFHAEDDGVGKQGSGEPDSEGRTRSDTSAGQTDATLKNADTGGEWETRAREISQRLEIDGGPANWFSAQISAPLARVLVCR